MLRVRPAAIGGGHLFDLRFVHLRERIQKRFGLCLVCAERFERHSPVRLLGRIRNLLHGILRTFSAKDVFVLGIREVINLLWLPGLQIFKIWLESPHGPGKLLGKRNRIACQIERFCRQHSGGLMVAVVFPDERSGKESEDHFRARQTNNAHQLLEAFPVIPIGQRLKHVLRGGILAAQKPYVRNAKRRQGVPRFDLSNGAERRGLLRPSLIGAAAAPRAIDYGDAFMLIERPRQIRSRRAFVIWMRHHQQKIRFVPLVGQRQRFWLLRNRSAQQYVCIQRNNEQRSRESQHGGFLNRIISQMEETCALAQRFYSMKSQGFAVLFPAAALSANPTRRNKSWKRGSLRKGSKLGSTLRVVRIPKCSEYAFSRSARASSLSPIPRCAQSIITGSNCSCRLTSSSFSSSCRARSG